MWISQGGSAAPLLAAIAGWASGNDGNILLIGSTLLSIPSISGPKMLEKRPRFQIETRSCLTKSNTKKSGWLT